MVVVVQPLGHVQLFVTSPWTAAHQASLSFTIFWSFIGGGNGKVYSHCGRQSLFIVSTPESSVLVSYDAKPRLLYDEASVP